MKLGAGRKSETPSGRSREGAWIEMLSIATLGSNPTVAPARERGLKCRKGHRVYPLRAVAPVRERGLK